MSETEPIPRYFTWLAAVCDEMGWPRARGRKMINDVSWHGCFDDGMSPVQAANEYRRKMMN